MVEWVQMVGSLVSVLMLCGIIFKSVRSLQECIDHLRRQLSETETKRQEMAERLSRVEEATDHVQYRLDVIEQRRIE